MIKGWLSYSEITLLSPRSIEEQKRLLLEVMGLGLLCGRHGFGGSLGVVV